ncbi:hypothetical protein [Streptomyces sp. NRRL F-5630]|uniref:hypothetical protein n=1 Tax=Streptomyces sp. NRRL F-5630 TaxID=1463864 RepID=UPI003D7139C0
MPRPVQRHGTFTARNVRPGGLSAKATATAARLEAGQNAPHTRLSRAGLRLPGA